MFRPSLNPQTTQAPQMPPQSLPGRPGVTEQNIAIRKLEQKELVARPCPLALAYDRGMTILPPLDMVVIILVKNSLSPPRESSS